MGRCRQFTYKKRHLPENIRDDGHLLQTGVSGHFTYFISSPYLRAFPRVSLARFNKLTALSVQLACPGWSPLCPCNDGYFIVVPFALKPIPIWMKNDRISLETTNPYFSPF